MIDLMFALVACMFVSQAIGYFAIYFVWDSWLLPSCSWGWFFLPLACTGLGWYMHWPIAGTMQGVLLVIGIMMILTAIVMVDELEHRRS